MPKDKVNNPQGKNQYTGAAGAGVKTPYKYSVGGFFATKQQQSQLEGDAWLADFEAQGRKASAEYVRANYKMDPALLKEREKSRETLKALPKELPESKTGGYAEPATKADFARSVAAGMLIGKVAGPVGMVAASVGAAVLSVRQDENIATANKHLRDSRAEQERLRTEVANRRQAAKATIDAVSDIENRYAAVHRAEEKALADSMVKSSVASRKAADYQKVSNTKSYATNFVKQEVAQVKNSVHSFFNKTVKRK